MGIDLGKIGKAFGGIIKILPAIAAAVGAVEKLTTGIKGKDKEDAAVDLIRDFIPLLEGAISRDVVDDELVQQALREAIRATVSLMNVVNDAKARRALNTPQIPGM